MPKKPSNKTIKTRIYKGDFIAGTLLVAESRKIARLLLDNVTEEAWNKAIRVDNILQKQSLDMAMRQAKLIRQRLCLMKPAFWQFVSQGTYELAAQALLAATVKHNRLIGDFLLRVVKQHWQMFENKLTTKDWHNFLEECTHIEPTIAHWTESTRQKLGSLLFSMLAEAHYIDSIRSKQITPIFIVSELRSYLTNNNENYILSCLDIN